MYAFNVIAGIVTIGSLLFSLWVHCTSKRKEAVEKERFNSLSSRLQDLLNAADAVAAQINLLGVMCDREETSKKELKHLAVALLATVGVIQKSIDKELAASANWSFGIPSVYLKLDSTEKRIPKETCEVS